MATYAYEKIGDHEIRVLSLKPGSFPDDLVCTLSPVSLPINPKYEALSYTWGKDISEYHLILDGSLVPVTKNLERALRHLRIEDQPRSLWVDAICINQDDMPERMLQVLHMNIIYSKAERTLIYLGDLDYESGKGLDALTMFSQDRHFKDLPIWKDDERQHIDFTFFERLNRLLEYPWWNRTWVLQEAALAREIQLICGDRSLCWDTVVLPATVSVLKHVGGCCKKAMTGDDGERAFKMFGQAFYHTVENVGTNRKDIQRGDSPALILLLKTYRNKQATDPRDKVYGLLGIASDDCRITPDYSIPVEEVYKRTAVQLITTYGDPAISSQQSLGLSLDESSNLPSWVPDWRVPFNSTQKANSNYFHHRTTLLYSAGQGLPFFVYRIPDSDFLCVDGLQFDEIAELSDPITRISHIEMGKEKVEEVLTAFKKTLVSWEDKIARKERGSELYPGGGDWPTAYFQTIVADLIAVLKSEAIVDGREHELDIMTIAYRFFRGLRYMMGIESTLEIPAPEISKGEIQPSLDAEKRLQHTFTAIESRRLFMTKSGYIGTVPETTLIGDTIHIMGGATTPMVLRRGTVTVRERNKVGHRVVGDAYVHGIMDGEACDRTRSIARYLLY